MQTTVYTYLYIHYGYGYKETLFIPMMKMASRALSVLSVLLSNAIRVWSENYMSLDNLLTRSATVFADREILLNKLLFSGHIIVLTSVVFC